MVEVETEDSVLDSETINQWQDYDEAYLDLSSLTVLTGSKEKAERLLSGNGIT